MLGLTEKQWIGLGIVVAVCMLIRALHSISNAITAATEEAKESRRARSRDVGYIVSELSQIHTDLEILGEQSRETSSSDKK
jgi:hypothetical protein